MCLYDSPGKNPKPELENRKNIEVKFKYNHNIAPQQRKYILSDNENIY